MTSVVSSLFLFCFICGVRTQIYEGLHIRAHIHDRGMKCVWGTHNSQQRSRTCATLINLPPTLAARSFFTATLYPKRPWRCNMALLVSLRLNPRAFGRRLALRAATPQWLRRLFLDSYAPFIPKDPSPKALAPTFSFDFLLRLKSG